MRWQERWQEGDICLKKVMEKTRLVSSVPSGERPVLAKAERQVTVRSRSGWLQGRAGMKGDETLCLAVPKAGLVTGEPAGVESLSPGMQALSGLLGLLKQPW